jgi:hypothetical protein
LIAVGDTATFIELDSVEDAVSPGVDRRRLSIALYRIDILPG